jgi:ribosomal protein S27AE
MPGLICDICGLPTVAFGGEDICLSHAHEDGHDDDEDYHSCPECGAYVAGDDEQLACEQCGREYLSRP